MSTQSSNNVYSYILFFIWPVLGLIASLRQYKEVWAKNILWLFVIFYGYNFVIPNKGADSNSYLNKFVLLSRADVNFGNFTDYLSNSDTNYVDILEPLISYTLSTVSDKPNLLFAVYGLVFGFFYSRNIFSVLKELKGTVTVQSVIVFILFAFSIGIWEINGFRFWTAAHIFFYGAYPYITKKDKSRLVFVIVAAFMHFSFMMPLAILIVYVLSGNRVKLFYILFLLSFLISEVSTSAVREYITAVLPDMFSSKVNAYTSDSYVEVVQQKKQAVSAFNTIAKYAELLLRLTVISLIYLRLKSIKDDKVLQSFFSFILLFFSIANVISLIPSGGRFLVLANLFLYAFVFLYLQKVKNNKELNKFLLFYSPIIVYIIVYNLRIIALDTFNLFTIIGNPLLVMFLE